MAVEGSKEAILERIRMALKSQSENVSEKPDFQSEIYAQVPDQDMVVRFAETFSDRKGILYYSQSLEEFRAQLSQLVAQRGFKHIHAWEKELVEELRACSFGFSSTDRNFQEMDCGVSLCECLISRTGSILVSSRQLAGRRLTIYPPTHIVVASAGQMVPDIKEAMAFMQKKYGQNLPSMISMITGASRTADIEKTLVMGAHGPRELILFLIDDAEAAANS